MYEIEFFEDANGYSEIVAYIKELERAKRNLAIYGSRRESNGNMEKSEE